MPFTRRTFGGLACLALFLLAVPVQAEVAPDPLRLVSEDVDLFVKVDQPRKLVETVTTLDLVKQLQQIDVVKELYDSTTLRRYFQLLAYFEKQIGAKWPEALDRLAGGGAVLAVQFDTEPPTVLLVVQGKDEALLQKFAETGLQVIEQELGRQESKDKIEKGLYQKIATYRIGKEYHAAAAGSALLFSNSEQGLHGAIDRHLDGGKKSLAGVKGVAEARKMLPAEPLAWAWLNLENVRQFPQVKDIFKQPNDNFLLSVPFGGLLDVAGRAPFLCAGFYQEKDSFRLTFRLPRGREGMAPEMAVHIPPADQPGSRPLLEPKGVVLSTSFYLDVSKFWEDRARLFNKETAQALEDFDKDSGRILFGQRLSNLLTKAGAYHRIVVAHQEKRSYKKAPKLLLPAFAAVIEMRDPDGFSRSMETLLRAAALGLGNQYKLKLTEEKHGNYEIVGYLFPEKIALKEDVSDLRFNFSPCFVRVGNQFVVSSTLELAHELIDLLEKEAKSSVKGSAAASRTQVYASGGVEILKDFEDQLMTQIILGQAVPADEARKQVQALTDLVRQLGMLQIETTYSAKEYHFDIRLKMSK